MSSLSAYANVGILRDILLPNLAFHTSLAVPAYLLARSTNYVEVKDYLWSAGQVGNAWWSAVGRRVAAGVPLATALATISRPGWLLLAGVTLWGGRLFYREASRALHRKADDPRYAQIKATPGGWTRAAYELFAPEVLAQALITIPFTAPFRVPYPIVHAPRDFKGSLEALAIGLFSVGLTLEFLADYQLGEHQKSGKTNLLRDGVWSIVRHPNYLGDALIHASFPILLYATDLFNPLTLLGPLTNWFFLRFVSGDHENERSQTDRYSRENPEKKQELDNYRWDKNAFWPGFSEITNAWTWVVLGAGVGGVFLERAVRRVLA
ncbi:hypothetical protein Q5752_006373 [Cryptotrichosporon argae]